MSITLRNQILKILLLISFLIALAVYLTIPINLTAVDIGRHIKNGEMLLSGQGDVLYKNFYSFTHPDYPFVNHHWFFGIIAYLLFHVSGFEGLAIFYMFLLMLAFLLAFDSARRYANFNVAFFVSVIAFLSLTSRAEIRPEGFSVLFAALIFWLLQRLHERSISDRLVLLIIPVVQILWVNIHIFFFLGPVLIGLFLWKAKLECQEPERIRFLQKLILISIGVNMINPSGIGGMLTPLNGFKEFGYSLAENQSVYFMVNRFGFNPAYQGYIVAAFVLAVGMVLCVIRERMKALPIIVLGVLIILAAFKAIRLILPFGFLFIPLAAYCYAQVAKNKIVGILMGVLSILAVSYMCFLPIHPHFGLVPNVNASANFVKQHDLKGPIFSNYDIGGYLIYHLSDREKVFVDNRQEAFPPDFFRKVYIPMQEDPDVWQKMSEQYQFNLIYFYRHDLTPWGQGFLVERISDPRWAPVFVDDYAIIFARRGGINQAIIDRFELPKDMFKATKK